MTCYRSSLHSFWHDNPDESQTKEKYARRIARLSTLSEDGRPILFVRAVATTDELSRAGELLELLRDRFGELAHLLMIVDFQKTRVGPVVVDGFSQLVVHFLSG